MRRAGWAAATLAPVNEAARVALLQRLATHSKVCGGCKRELDARPEASRSGMHLVGVPCAVEVEGIPPDSGRDGNPCADGYLRAAARPPQANGEQGRGDDDQNPLADEPGSQPAVQGITSTRGLVEIGAVCPIAECGKEEPQRAQRPPGHARNSCRDDY